MTAKYFRKLPFGVGIHFSQLTAWASSVFSSERKAPSQANPWVYLKRE